MRQVLITRTLIAVAILAVVTAVMYLPQLVAAQGSFVQRQSNPFASAPIPSAEQMQHGGVSGVLPNFKSQPQRDEMARLQSYCTDMARIAINDDLEKVLPGVRAESAASCVAAAVRTAQYRNGQ